LHSRPTMHLRPASVRAYEQRAGGRLITS